MTVAPRRYPRRVPDVATPTPHLDPAARVERLWLDDTSWVDVVRGWVAGTDGLAERFAALPGWSQGRLWRYERWVDEPRLGRWYDAGRGPDPVLVEAQRAITARYRVGFDGFSLIWYRDGRDSVAFHRDRELRHLDETLIAILTFGARRPWLLRPRSHRYAHDLDRHGATHDLAPGDGDLLVLGGRAQADWEHAVPKHPGAGSRISAQWRWTSGRGQPVVGGSYRSARMFD
jgi:alkylated DNA repair dioxygenase AlkB